MKNLSKLCALSLFTCFVLYSNMWAQYPFGKHIKQEIQVRREVDYTITKQTEDVADKPMYTGSRSITDRNTDLGDGLFLVIL